ncbi:lipid kinase [Bacteroidia bacterium]|nr:lipid kinase [Bacteroidia bacterium]
MRKVKFVYNPLAGDTLIPAYLDKIVAIYQKHSLSLVPYRLTFEGDNFEREIVDDLDDSFDHILMAGGDGTVNFMVNLLQRRGIDMPLAILPAGTANDFGRFVGMPGDVMRGCEAILGGKTTAIDLGLVNGSYFCNVLACGLFTDVSYKTATLAKNTFGRLAYFFGGLSELPKFKRLKLDIVSDGGNYSGSCLILMVFNGQSAGQFKIARNADLNDGLLDVVILKGENTLVALAQTLVRVGQSLLASYNLNLDEIVHFQCSQLTVRSSSHECSDIDGQEGPCFPLDIRCVPNCQKIILPG